MQFLVDTGSDRTVLSLFDFEVRLGLPAATFPMAPGRMSGIGAQVLVHACRGTLYLPNDAAGWLQFPTQFLVPESLPGHVPLDFNVLGADIWGQGDVHVNRPAGLVSLDFPDPNPSRPN